MQRSFVVPAAVAFAATTAVLVAPARPVWAQDLKESRIKASYLTAFGRLPETVELNDWMHKPDMTVGQIVEQHKGFLRGNGVEKDRVINAAMKTAWGSNDFPKYFAKYLLSIGSKWNTYTELVDLMVRDMDSDKKFKEDIIRSSYAVVGLTPSATDIYGWVNGFGNGKSYVRIVAEHLLWMQDNKKPLPTFATQAAVTLSPQAVKEMRSMTGSAQIIANGGNNFAANGGGRVVAMGGANVIAVGGGN